jgi:hypothetical protein
MNVFGRRNAGQSPDEQAIARYRYLLKTAPPETIEQAHAEAFAQLTPDQRRLVLQQITERLPASERPLAEQNALSPQTLARLATRAEMRHPGSTERMFGQAGGASLGGVIAGGLLSSIAGAVIGSVIARQFFDSVQGAADPAQDWESAEADPASGEGDSLDMGGDFDV